MQTVTSDGAPKAKVFVSYSRADLDFVEQLAAGLAAAGIEPKIDRNDIYSFEDWWKRIEVLIAEADSVIVVLSPDALASKVCRDEVDYAVSLQKRLAPIVCRSVAHAMDHVPPALGALNFIVFDAQGAFEAPLGKLIDALSTDISWVRRHTAFGLEARAWDEAGRPAGLLLRSPRLEEAEHWIASRPPGAPAPTPATRTYILASRTGATRRRNALTASLAAGLAIASLLAGTAFWQRHVAERNFVAARSAVDGLVTNISSGLEDVPGLTIGTTRKILSTAEGTMDTLLAAAPADPRLRRSQATMLRLFSANYLKSGDQKEAERASSASVRAARAFVDSQPASTDVLVMSLLQRASALMHFGRRQEALQVFDEARAVAQRRAAERPSDPGARLLVASALTGIGDTSATTPDRVKAYRQALAVAEAVNADSPLDDARNSVSASLDRLADMQESLGHIDDALAMRTKGLKLDREDLASRPDSKNGRRNLVLALWHYGDLQATRGDHRGALASFEDASATAHELVGLDPSIEDSLVLEANMLGRVAAEREAAGDARGAASVYAEASAMARRISARNPSNNYLLANVASSLITAGRAKLAAGDTEGAIADFAEAMPISRGVVARAHDENEQMRLELTSLGFFDSIYLGDAETKLGRRDRAAQNYAEAQALADAMLHASPTSAQARLYVRMAGDRNRSTAQAASSLPRP